MLAEWSLAASDARVGELGCAQDMPSRGHCTSVGGGFSNWREIFKAQYLEIGFDAMDAAAGLNLHGLGLDAEQLIALQVHLAASRPRPEVGMPAPPLFACHHRGFWLSQGSSVWRL
jgi:hypothetical protein